MQATFPHRLLRQETRFWLEGMSLEPRESVSGTETIVPTMRARWMASCSFVLRGEASRLGWEAFLAQMEGRVGTTLVPAHYRWRPRDRDGHPTAFCDIANLADAQTWEHFGFENTDLTRITVAADASLRATQIDVTLHNSTGLRPGQKFSIGDRLYRVQAHWQPSPTVHRLMFQPPLRQAVTAGAAVEVDRPVCKMRMVTETEGLFDQSLSVLPSVTVNFQEAI
ncbi:hypothetical protein F8A10_07680 [Paracoccus kondratievae]|uniref:hypothetical protein n=1 Tax=Paracoccus kondratievae TaxID=135740 RepID=UPI0012665C27|nr:hypothetical protein [Paracoccus kondratievae]QFQ87313.1 hypothetical protein F8A10_07680 [Paracoccus kondratievae]